MDTGNFVAKLNKYKQITGSELRYEDGGSAGRDHNKTFIQRVVLNNIVYPDGVGKTKREAKHNAAENALRCLMENKQPDSSETTESAAEASTASGHQTTGNINYICWLNEYGQKNRVDVKAVESTRPGPNNAVPFVVGDVEYPVVTGKTKRAAKEEAAKCVYDVICGSKTTEAADENYNLTPGQLNGMDLNVSDMCNKTRSLNLNSKDNSFTETNFIGLVNHYCQKTDRPHSFTEVERRGPPHNPQFLYKLVIDNKHYPVGEGKNKQEAKQNAAHLAWSALQEQSDWDSEVSVRSTASEDGAPPMTLGSMSASASDSVEFRDSSNHSKAQMSIGSSLFGSSFSTPTSVESQEPSKNMSMDKSDSIVFEDSANPTRDQDDVKNKRKEHSVSDASTQSRFTSEFDSIVLLGEGSFGRVYKAREKLLDKWYAIKMVDYREKALREVKALSDLSHQHIVRYYYCWTEASEYKKDSAGSDSNQPISNSSRLYLYIKMELCDTNTLKKWIKKRNKITQQDSKRREDGLIIAQQIVSGVEYIHSRNLIHRDLKPANIMFGRDRTVKIGDFGLVTESHDDDAENLLERTVDKGTPSYMAPEQKSEMTYNHKVDIFALGLIYFELLWKLSTGHERGVIWKAVRRQNLPTDFKETFFQEYQMITSMLCNKPEDRPEARTLKAELENLVQTYSKQQNMCLENATV